MIAGHFAVAAAVKSREKQVPLWSLMVATAWLDIIFVPLLLSGAESIGPAPGTTGGYGTSIIHADYSHSLIGALVLSGLIGGVAALFWDRRSGAVLAAVAFSHWILDLLFHRHDMPILPGNAGDLPRLGLGLWQIPALAVTIELVIVIVGSFLLWRATRSLPLGHRRRGDLVAALVLIGLVGTLLLDFTRALG